MKTLSSSSCRATNMQGQTTNGTPQLHLKADRLAKRASANCKIAWLYQLRRAIQLQKERLVAHCITARSPRSLSHLLQAMCLLDAQVQHLQLLMQHTAAEIWPRQSVAISLCSCCTDSWHSRVLLPAVMVARWGHSGQQAALIPTALT